MGNVEYIYIDEDGNCQFIKPSGKNIHRMLADKEKLRSLLRRMTKRVYHTNNYCNYYLEILSSPESTPLGAITARP